MRKFALVISGAALGVSAGLGPGCRREPAQPATRGVGAAAASRSAPKPASEEQGAETRALLGAAGFATERLVILVPRRTKPILGFHTQATDAVGTWERLRAITDKTGLYPLVVVDEHGMLASEEMLDQQPSAAEIVGASERIDPEAWFKQHFDEDVPRGDGKAETQSSFAVPFDILTGKPRQDVYIALIPTALCWEVPAYLGFGGWNDCPDPEVHVAVQRYWHQKYGAEIVCLAGDIVEMRVPPERSPLDQRSALELAKEQYGYSGGDLVDQGFGNLDALAGSLIRASTWYFWWD